MAPQRRHRSMSPPRHRQASTSAIDSPGSMAAPVSPPRGRRSRRSPSPERSHHVTKIIAVPRSPPKISNLKLLVESSSPNLAVKAAAAVSGLEEALNPPRELSPTYNIEVDMPNTPTATSSKHPRLSRSLSSAKPKKSNGKRSVSASGRLSHASRSKSFPPKDTSIKKTTSKRSSSAPAPLRADTLLLSAGLKKFEIESLKLFPEVEEALKVMKQPAIVTSSETPWEPVSSIRNMVINQGCTGDQRDPARLDEPAFSREGRTVTEHLRKRREELLDTLETSVKSVSHRVGKVRELKKLLKRKAMYLETNSQSSSTKALPLQRELPDPDSFASGLDFSNLPSPDDSKSSESETVENNNSDTTCAPLYIDEGNSSQNGDYEASSEDQLATTRSEIQPNNIPDTIDYQESLDAVVPTSLGKSTIGDLDSTLTTSEQGSSAADPWIVDDSDLSSTGNWGRLLMEYDETDGKFKWMDPSTREIVAELNSGSDLFEESESSSTENTTSPAAFKFNDILESPTSPPSSPPYSPDPIDDEEDEEPSSVSTSDEDDADLTTSQKEWNQVLDKGGEFYFDEKTQNFERKNPKLWDVRHYGSLPSFKQIFNWRLEKGEKDDNERFRERWNWVHANREGYKYGGTRFESQLRFVQGVDEPHRRGPRYDTKGSPIHRDSLPRYRDFTA